MSDPRVESIRNWWRTISTIGPQALGDAAHELCGLQGSASTLRLTPQIEVPCRPLSHESTRLLEQKPSFKTLTLETLAGLRSLVHHHRDWPPDAAASWGGALLRYCESFHATILRNAKLKWQSVDAAQLGLLHITAFFLEYYAAEHDLRYLNAALKLQETKAILVESAVTRELETLGDSLLACLLTINISVRTTAGVEDLQRGPMWRE